MYLVERMQVKKSRELTILCHKSKDIYNKANYIMRHYFFLVRESEKVAKEWLKRVNNYLISNPNDFEKVVNITTSYMKINSKETKRNKKKKNWDWYFPKNYKLRLTYTQLEKLIKILPEYETMPAQSAQQTLKKLIADWEGYRNKTIKYYEQRKKMKSGEFKSKYPKAPNIPGYKDKNGETNAYFTNQQCHIKDGFLTFPRCIGSQKSPRWLPPIKVRFRGKFNLVEIKPMGLVYIIEIIYTKKKEDYHLDKERVASIDIGVSNTVTMVDNIGSIPLVVKGGVVKSINQYFNKYRAKLISIKEKQGYKHWTNKLKKLSLKRYNKFHDIFHKYSRHIIGYCMERNIGTLVIGYNPMWKQNSNMGKRNNQNFVYIPFWKLIKMIQYKAELIGIEVILEDESYTSKCSFLDWEEIGWHQNYKGVRFCRGLFRASSGLTMNADVNAAFNIMKKALPKVKFIDGIEDIVLHPRCVNWLNSTHRNG